MFHLYRKHCTNKLIAILSDCSHSGHWVRECAKTLDSLHIPPCGHRARENRALIKVLASCQPHEEAAEPCHSVEAMSMRDDGALVYYTTQLTQQTSTWFNSTKLVCCRGPDSPCLKTTFRHLTWENAVDKSMNIQRIKRREGGRDMWYYIMVDRPGEDYREAFKAQYRKDPTLRLNDWGYILESGDGKDPPKEITEKVYYWTAIA